MPGFRLNRVLYSAAAVGSLSHPQCDKIGNQEYDSFYYEILLMFTPELSK